MPRLSYREALNQAMSEEMEKDQAIFLMGEEVGHYQGAYKVSQGLLQRFSERRVVDTPIAEMGFAGVGIGAFGAHGLRGRLSPEMLAIFETGARYHLYHALAIVATAACMARLDGRAPIVAGWCFAAGIFLFSGSLYALALTGVTTLGAITPLGGVAFLVGWIALAVAAF